MWFLHSGSYMIWFARHSREKKKRVKKIAWVVKYWALGLNKALFYVYRSYNMRTFWGHRMYYINFLQNKWIAIVVFLYFHSCWLMFRSDRPGCHFAMMTYFQQFPFWVTQILIVDVSIMDHLSTWINLQFYFLNPFITLVKSTKFVVIFWFFQNRAPLKVCWRVGEKNFTFLDYMWELFK